MDIDDRWAIAETVNLVGHIFDEGRLDAIGDVFTTDVAYDMSALGMPVITGIDGAQKAAQEMEAHGPIAHFVGNIVIVGEDDGQASVDSKGLMLMPDGTVTAVVNHDVVRRESTGWRIARRVIRPARTAASA